MANETMTMLYLRCEDEPREFMKAIFPRWSDRIRAYGKLIIIPTYKNPLEAFPILDALNGEKDDDQSPKPMSQAVRSVIEWGLEGDRISPEFRQHFESVLLVESAFKA